MINKKQIIDFLNSNNIIFEEKNNSFLIYIKENRYILEDTAFNYITLYKENDNYEEICSSKHIEIILKTIIGL